MNTNAPVRRFDRLRQHFENRRYRTLFRVEIERGAGCGGRLRILASIEELTVIAKILAHPACTTPNRYAGEL